VLRRLLVIESDFTVERFLATTPIERPGNREHFAEGLRRAGVPENDKDIAAFLVAEVSHLAT
jgi:hypothetical protein